MSPNLVIPGYAIPSDIAHRYGLKQSYVYKLACTEVDPTEIWHDR